MREARCQFSPAPVPLLSNLGRFPPRPVDAAAQLRATSNPPAFRIACASRSEAGVERRVAATLAGRRRGRLEPAFSRGRGNHDGETSAHREESYPLNGIKQDGLREDRGDG